ncbi:hypothetical protein L2U69_13165 [Zavarzinia compransoris]|uniref:hypothetical protein n=1 Tax=Zavarzinia marina TaxID=2911065 RepID=UPI001F3499DE|nr:hypothetical protein [Zavarzinia marina]MCF4166597.1 hypothetical protein [Zavarzinia marina]
MSFYLGMSAAAQRQAVSDAMDRTYLLIKQGMEVQKAKELARVTAKYSSESRLPELQARMDSLSATKSAADDAVSTIKSAADTAQNVLEKLNAMHAAAAEGNAGAFDAALTQINIMVGSRDSEFENLIGNVLPGQTGAGTRFVDAGATQVMVQLRSLGSRFLLTEQGTGQRIDTNFYDQTLVIDGRQIATSDLSLVSREDDTLTFTDGTDTWTADLQRGGLSVSSAWTYGGLTGDGQTLAISDVGDSIKIVTKALANLQDASLQGDVGVTVLKNRLESLGDEALALNDTESDALAAEKKAIQVRYDMALGNLAFAAQAQREVIGVMIAEDPVTNQSVFEIMGSAYGG